MAMSLQDYGKPIVSFYNHGVLGSMTLLVSKALIDLCQNSSVVAQ